jgi:hypothetical protein
LKVKGPHPKPGLLKEWESAVGEAKAALLKEWDEHLHAATLFSGSGNRRREPDAALPKNPSIKIRVEPNPKPLRRH